MCTADILCRTDVAAAGRPTDRPTARPSIGVFFFDDRAAAVRSRQHSLRLGNYRARAFTYRRHDDGPKLPSDTDFVASYVHGRRTMSWGFFSPFPVFLCPRTLSNRSLVRVIYLIFFFLILLFISTRTGYHRVYYIIEITILRCAHMIRIMSCT